MLSTKCKAAKKPNPKTQAPRKSQIPIAGFRARRLVIENWNLFGAWDLKFPIIDSADSLRGITASVKNAAWSANF